MRFTAATAAFLSTLSLASAWAVPSQNKGYGSGSDNEFKSLGCPNTTKEYATPAEQIKAWDDFSNLLYIQKNVQGAFDKYVATGYINHAPDIPTNGSAAAVAELSQFVPISTATPRNVFVGYNENGTAFGMAHVKFFTPGRGEAALADYIRMIGTCLVEHWDVTAPVENSTNPIAYF